MPLGILITKYLYLYLGELMKYQKQDDLTTHDSWFGYISRQYLLTDQMSHEL